MGIREHRGAIEAILFASGEPISAGRIAEVIGVDAKTVHKLLQQLSDEYDERGCGLCILRLEDSYQMTSRQEYADAVRAALDMRRNAPLSQAALEVLAIVAYNQPVTRAFMEQIRGVDCSGVVATLCEKELIEESGRLELPGRPIAFRTTPNFLRAFGLSSLRDLPVLPDRGDPTSLAEALPAAQQENTFNAASSGEGADALSANTASSGEGADAPSANAASSGEGADALSANAASSGEGAEAPSAQPTAPGGDTNEAASTGSTDDAEIAL